MFFSSCPDSDEGQVSRCPSDFDRGRSRGGHTSRSFQGLSASAQVTDTQAFHLAVFEWGGTPIIAMNNIQSLSSRPSPWLLGSGLALAILAGGCISPQLLKDKENEIVTLREERAALKKQLRLAQNELSSLELALQEASVNPVEAVDYYPPPIQDDFPDLDAVGISTSHRQGDLVINVPAEVTFASGKAKLTDQGKSALRVVASTLSRDYDGFKYWIEGHTDSDPISKAKFDSNRDLSVARALAVLHFLVEECQIPDSQCVVAGHGEYRPVAANNGASKALNRRVEIVVHRAE